MGKLARLEELFAGRHFDREVIILCVRWYLRFKLSLRDLVEMMAERDLSLAHTTIMRWVQHYTPEFEKRWHRYALAVGQSWRVAGLLQLIGGRQSGEAGTDDGDLDRGRKSGCRKQRGRGGDG